MGKFYARDGKATLERFMSFPAIAIYGPRQSGKSTLAQEVFKNHTYLTLEDARMEEFASRDPKGFLATYENPHGLIIDEVQRVPELMRYVQIAIDAQDRPGYFVLTGSRNFEVIEAVSQSLAGRVAILNLLPLSIHECRSNGLLLELDDMMFTGGYPRIYKKQLDSQDFYSGYVSTYLERDVRHIARIDDLKSFYICMKLCAGRVGQLINYQDLAVHCGVDHRTIKRWIKILHESYILFPLAPRSGNFNTQVVKSAKIFFYDTGLLCHLLGIQSSRNLSMSHYRGHVFENFIIADLCKQYYNKGRKAPLYFWRNKNARLEVDCIIERSEDMIALEMKAGKTVIPDYFSALNKWQQMTEYPPSKSFVIYGGDDDQRRSTAHVLGWRSADDMPQLLESLS